jgi:hypothetical protein
MDMATYQLVRAIYQQVRSLVASLFVNWFAPKNDMKGVMILNSRLYYNNNYYDGFLYSDHHSTPVVIWPCLQSQQSHLVPLSLSASNHNGVITSTDIHRTLPRVLMAWNSSKVFLSNSLPSTRSIQLKKGRICFIVICVERVIITRSWQQTPKCLRNQPCPRKSQRTKLQMKDVMLSGI